MDPSDAPVRAKRKGGLTISELDGEVLVYDPATLRASCLNSFAAEVLARCDGERAPAEIARDLPFDHVDERVVRVALSDLGKAELIEIDSPIDARTLTGPSRREFFKHLSIGTAVAVPVVTAIVLPSPAEAGSIPLGESCNTVPNGPDPCYDDPNGPDLSCKKAEGSGTGNCDGGVNNCICQVWPP